jgi:hypothetical protein
VLVVGIFLGLILIAILVLLLNLTGKPTPSPAPSTVPGSSVAPTLAGSPPTSSAPSTPGPSAPDSTTLPTPVAASPGTPEALLLTHVPQTIAASCVTSPGTGDISVTASCTAAGAAINISYDQYGTLDAMNAAFDQEFAKAQIDPNSGSCEDHASWPAESVYDVAGAPAGRRYCADVQGTPTIYWTDERLNILSTASGADAAGLIAFWTNEAGPLE